MSFYYDKVAEYVDEANLRKIIIEKDKPEFVLEGQETLYGIQVTQNDRVIDSWYGIPLDTAKWELFRHFYGDNYSYEAVMEWDVYLATDYDKFMQKLNRLRRLRK